MAYYNIKGEPFRYKGAVDVSDCKTSEEVMIKAGLNFTVDKCELFAKMKVNIDGSDEQLDSLNKEMQETDSHLFKGDMYRNCQNGYATYRTDYNIPLGVVKQKYTIVQNTEAFSFFDNAVGKNQALFQTAGCFGKGETIFVSAKLPFDILVKGDPVDNYLVFTNNHDGTAGVKMLFTPIRVVCKNTLSAAIRTTTNYVSFKHTKSIHKNIDLAQELLGICKKQRDIVQTNYDFLANIKVTDDETMEYIVKSILSDDELQQLKLANISYKSVCYKNVVVLDNTTISTRKINVISDIWNYYNEGIGQREIQGTMWGAYNAFTGFWSNCNNAVGENRMNSLLYGDKGRKIQNALALALTY